MYALDYHTPYAVDQQTGARRRIYRHVIDRLEVVSPRKKLLDIGTGCGELLTIAIRRGWHAKGIEPSFQSAAIAMDKYGLDVFRGTLQDYNVTDRFGAATLINVLDHSTEPWVEIERLAALLVDKGALYLRFPNGALHAIIYQIGKKLGLSKLINRYLVFHQFAFSPDFIRRLLQDKGFRIIEITNSPLSIGDPHNLFYSKFLMQSLKILISLYASWIGSMTGNKLLLAPSLEVLALKAVA